MPALPDMTLKVGDTDPRVDATLKHADGKVVVLSVTDTITFRLRPVVGNVPAAWEHAASLLTNGADGKVFYQWSPADTATPGLYEGDFHVVFADGVRRGSWPSEYSLLIEIISAP